ncbi:MAG: hypothetical protein HY435_02625 [Candidatus Liptonbacteria bacterium]|nr:hypothetical protein [Candidatus Liptonbacteria bacterium]
MATRRLLTKTTFTKDTLLRIAAIGILTIAAGTSPYFLHRIVKTYFKDKVRKMQRARAKKLRELERRKLVRIEELPDGKVRIELTHRGKQLVRTYDLEHMKLTAPKRWDGSWKVVIYDIPASQKKASNAFREKLKQLGLFPLQRSVWISPYDCLREIEFLATVFEIDMDKCICYFSTKDVPREKEMRKFFNL